ncbi:MAG: hypothetical protein A2261_01075 [Candidatus Magasanikbacteria bacterium RIFOXYA2_FULL_44_8]|uniref:Uncharacterized protein n=1 Tax=Candidatus Magasanikbacteria bacterium RIFOXYA2_FULL_44_8 TaxID=1798696 RepID=A0A1F6NJY0_9BACT|nr:MAG: hypothetical protein A2261_01075 [Candidatus Magasanikbacteria bacterium RIFOXYA2_FULL_44_8]
MRTHLKNLIQTIVTGSPTEVRAVQKQVEKFWHDYYIPHREDGRKAFQVFLDELKNFDQIKDINHQAYFINTLKWPLLATGEKNFEEWADFILANIQNPSGKIRQAVIRATEYLIMGIQVDLKCFGKKGKKLASDIVDIIAKNRKRFGDIVMDVEDLVDRYFESKFKKYKYVSSLPAGVYKSLNILITDVLLRSEFYQKFYQDYLNELRANRKGFKPPKITLVDIWEKRQEIETKLLDLIDATNSVLKFDDIKDIIYNEAGNDSIKKSSLILITVRMLKS